MAILLDDAVPQYLLCATTPLTAAPISMVAWFKTDTVAVSQAFLSIGDSGANSWFGMLIHSTFSGKLLGYTQQDASVYPYAISGAVAVVNTWYHAVVVYGSASSRKVYLNSVVSAEETTAATPTSLDRIGIGVIARSSLFDYMSGALAEVALYNDALSQAEVDALYAKDAPPIVSPDSLVAYWPLIDDLTDDKGGYNMTAFGAGAPAYTDHVPGMNYGGSSIPFLSLYFNRLRRA